MEEQKEDEGNTGGEKSKTATDKECVKIALESLFSEQSQEGSEHQLNVEEIPERIRPLLLDKWTRLRSNLDSSRPHEPDDPSNRNAGKEI